MICYGSITIADHFLQYGFFCIAYELPFELVYTPKVLDLNGFPKMRDTKDPLILATALMEGIEVLVTGDKNFLVLDVDIPEIVMMAEFLERY